MQKKISALEHLKLLALRSAASSAEKISELASAVSEALEEMENLKADKVTSVSITIPVSTWATNTDADPLAAGFLYHADVVVSGLTANDSTETVLDFASLEVAKTCGMANTTTPASGKIRYYAVNKPTAALTAQVRVTKGQAQ